MTKVKKKVNGQTLNLHEGSKNASVSLGQKPTLVEDDAKKNMEKALKEANEADVPDFKVIAETYHVDAMALLKEWRETGNEEEDEKEDLAQNEKKEDWELVLSWPVVCSQLSNDELYKRTLAAANRVKWSFAELIPLCQAAIKKYKRQGTAEEDRDGEPTVEAFFASVGLNYSTVRTWIERWKKKESDMFPPPKVPRLNAADVAVTKLKASTLKLVEDAETGKKTLEEVKEALAPPPADEEVEHIESLADETLPVLLNQLLDEINLFFEDPLVLTDPAKPPMPKTMSEVVDAINKVLPMLNRKKAA